jgi:hypothetical protein
MSKLHGVALYAGERLVIRFLYGHLPVIQWLSTCSVQNLIVLAQTFQTTPQAKTAFTNLPFDFC